MLSAMENTGAPHENVLADCGFCDYEHLEKMVDENKPQKFYVPDARFGVEERGGSKLGKYDSCHLSSMKAGLSDVPRERNEEDHDKATRWLYLNAIYRGCL